MNPPDCNQADSSFAELRRNPDRAYAVGLYAKMCDWPGPLAQIKHHLSPGEATNLERPSPDGHRALPQAVAAVPYHVGPTDLVSTSPLPWCRLACSAPVRIALPGPGVRRDGRGPRRTIPPPGAGVPRPCRGDERSSSRFLSWSLLRSCSLWH